MRFKEWSRNSNGHKNYEIFCKMDYKNIQEKTDIQKRAWKGWTPSEEINKWAYPVSEEWIPNQTRAS